MHVRDRRPGLTAKVEGAPILIAGAGRMGGALIAGWRAAGVAADQILIRDPAPGDVARTAVAAGAALNPENSALRRARSVILAVKPAGWREAAAELAPLLAEDAIVVSTLAGVGLAAVQDAFPAHPVARAMPTTAVAIGKGPISLIAADAAARARAMALFAPLGEVVELAGEV
ncbi:MAG: NAD(P)-binding domain-containing protein, partial [Caulobacteraceae bacterium]